MNKVDYVNRISEKLDLTKKDVNNVINELFELMKEDLKNNNLPTLVCLHFGVAEDKMQGNWWFESCQETALLGNRKEVKAILKNDKNIMAVF